MSRFNARGRRRAAVELHRGACSSTAWRASDMRIVTRARRARSAARAAEDGAARGHYDALIALGAVIRGETYHFEIVSNESRERHHDGPARHRRADRQRHTDDRQRRPGARAHDGERRGLRDGRDRDGQPAEEAVTQCDDAVTQDAIEGAGRAGAIGATSREEQPPALARVRAAGSVSVAARGQGPGDDRGGARRDRGVRRRATPATSARC